MRRKRASRKRDRKLFKKTSRRTHRKNTLSVVPRGGYRL